MSVTTSFDIYLCGASISSVGLPPKGGCNSGTVKDHLHSELNNQVIVESNLNIRNVDNSIFHMLFTASSLTVAEHVGKINYYGKKNGTPVYSGGKWNFNHQKRSKQNRGDTNDDTGSDEDEALNSNGSVILSEDSDGTCDDDEYDEYNPESGSKRRCRGTLERCITQWAQVTSGIEQKNVIGYGGMRGLGMIRGSSHLAVGSNM